MLKMLNIAFIYQKIMKKKLQNCSKSPIFTTQNLCSEIGPGGQTYPHRNSSHSFAMHDKYILSAVNSG